MIMLICNQSLSGCKCFFLDETAFGTNEHTSNLPPLFPFFYFYYISKYSKKMRDMWDKISLLSVTSRPLLSPVQFIYTILTWQRKLNRTTRVTWVLCSICTAHVFWPHIAVAKCMIIKLIEPVTLRPINRWMRGIVLDALESTVAVCSVPLSSSPVNESVRVAAYLLLQGIFPGSRDFVCFGLF